MFKTSHYIFICPILLAISMTLADGRCLYCVANPKASDKLIQVKLDSACGYIPEACDMIRPGAPCYVPNDLRTTASYVFNDYYIGGAECDFDGAEINTEKDPSHGDCKFKCLDVGG